MTNDEFQKLMLMKFDLIEKKLTSLEKEQNILIKTQNEMNVDLKEVCEQMAILTQYRNETKEDLSDLKDTFTLYFT